MIKKTTITHSVITEKRLFWLFLAVIVSCLIFYTYCVTSTIHHIVARNESRQKITQINSRMSAEEFEYIKLKGEVTLERAHALGFHEVDNKIFVSPHSVGYVAVN